MKPPFWYLVTIIKIVTDLLTTVTVTDVIPYKRKCGQKKSMLSLKT